MIQDSILVDMKQVFFLVLGLVYNWYYHGSLISCYMYKASIASAHTRLVGSLATIANTNVDTQVQAYTRDQHLGMFFTQKPYNKLECT
jgi:hypothetical protein